MIMNLMRIYSKYIEMVLDKKSLPVDSMLILSTMLNTNFKYDKLYMINLLRMWNLRLISFCCWKNNVTFSL